MTTLFVDAKSASLFTSVLLIAHDAETLSFWARSLSLCSPYYNILKASTAADAIELLRLKPLDCVVLDLDPPDPSLRIPQCVVPDHRHPPLAVVVLTGAPTKNVHSIALEHGADVCVGKASLGPRSLDGIVQDAISNARKRRLHDQDQSATHTPTVLR
jgi:DNA-binding NarL/FixJ family response regulator